MGGTITLTAFQSSCVSVREFLNSSRVFCIPARIRAIFVLVNTDRGAFRLKIARLSVCVAVLVAVTGCTDNFGIFGLEETEPAYIVETIDDGTVLGSETALSFSLTVSSGDIVDLPESAEVEILNAAGETVVVMGFEKLDELPEDENFIEYGDLPDGVYTLRLRLLRGAEIVNTIDRQFFVLSQDVIISQTLVYPPTVEPDSLGIARAELVYPEEYDPYARWEVDGRVVAEGYWRNGADTVRFTTPTEDGAFFLDLAIYPFGADDGVDLARTAPFTHHGDVFVSSDRLPGQGELTPNDGYLDVYHFAGNLRNAAPEWLRSDDARFEGTPQVLIEQGVFGYYLDGTASIIVDRSFLPSPGMAVKTDLIVLPFTLAPEATILRTVTDAGAELSVRVGDQSDLIVTYEDTSFSEREFRIPALFPDESEVMHLSLFLREYEATYHLSFVKNGIPLQPVEIPVAPRVSDGEILIDALPGSTEIGGSDGITGIVDEFGIAGTAPETIREEIQRRHTETLLDRFGTRLLASDVLVPVTADEPHRLTIREPGSAGARILLSLPEEMTGTALKVTIARPSRLPEERVLEPDDTGQVVIPVFPTEIDGAGVDLTAVDRTAALSDERGDVEILIAVDEGAFEILDIAVVENRFEAP